ncbi:hypothetical protein [Bacillus sp. T33-2]|uniref:hypothetical protein n=1 Tax=Bacillus sp. T33-2 TaxID=2054168 RepID=UPI000C7748BD|nr:hypothetical protein [Bacillus sp. T33-2]PLR90840.1 hypothetical protein CVD19_22230 [Bacillus sp. T33-2]
MDVSYEIGGFFELSMMMNEDAEYHHNAIKLNSGRNALLYILESKQIKKLYAPKFICDSVTDKIHPSIEIQYYSVDKKLEPLLNHNILEDEYLLYVNYYGIHKKNVRSVIEKYQRVIVDNTQAFFERPIGDEPTFYSPRKFFGVPDGAYLYVDETLKRDLDTDFSFDRAEHLLKRVELPADVAYNVFVQNEQKLNNLPLKKMSILTQLLLQNIQYTKAKKIREDNFMFLHGHLKHINQFNLDVSYINGPMVYPLYYEEDGLREYLIQNKIYIPTFWKDALTRVKSQDFEFQLINNVVPLPIDHRYSNSDMSKIVESIYKYISKKRCRVER